MKQQRLDDVKDFVIKSKTRLQKILDRLDWSEAGVLKNYNSNSVASSNCQKPQKICPTKIITYPESLIATNSLTLETHELQQLLKSDQIEAPQNFRELQANFSREQKLQIYEHVIDHTEKLENTIVPEVAEGEISLTEIFAQKKREEKRKKRKFRKSKPTHIEEVRSLVDLQMQAWLQFIENQQEKTTEEMMAKGKCHSLRKRSQSRDHHRRSKERTDESRRHYTNCSKDRTTKKRSHSRSYDHRKRSRSNETNKEPSTTSSYKSQSYQRNRYNSPKPSRRRDYENYYRGESISPQATSSRVDPSKDRHHYSSSSYTKSVYDTDDRIKYKHDNNTRGEDIGLDKGKYYSKHEKVDKYKDGNVSYRHRSDQRNEKRSKHKRKKHEK